MSKTMPIAVRTLIFALPFVALSACKDDDTESSGEKQQGPSLWVMDDQYSEMTSAQLASRLATDASYAKFSGDALALPKPSVSKLARVATGIDTCVDKKLNDLPVAVAADSLQVEYDLDLTALCDRAFVEGDTVTEVANWARGKLVLSCSDGNLERFEGKTLAEVRSYGSPCLDAATARFAIDMQYGARKVVTTTVGDVVTTNVSVEEGHYGYARDDGTACFRTYEDKEYVMEGCRATVWIKTFNGTPENEGLSPQDANGPYVVSGQVSAAGLVQESGAPYYSEGAATFWFNGWQGTLTFTNGWVAPRWSATRNEETAEGTLGQYQARDL